MPLLLSAQSNHQRKNKDVFPTQGNLERRGWIFSPAFTFMAPPLKQGNQRMFLGNDTVYDIAYNAGSKMGIGFEVGRFYTIDASRLISYVDVSLGYKSLRGTEKFEATLFDPDRSTPYSQAGEGTFALRYATLSFNASKINQLSDFSFLQNSLGLNVDYKFGEDIYYNQRRFPMQLADAPDILLQMHYRLGFGYKLTPKFMVITSLETPILNIYEYDDLKSTMKVFNSRYRPLILRVSIMMFDNKANRKCPPKGGNNRKSKETLFGMQDAKRPW